MKRKNMLPTPMKMPIMTLGWESELLLRAHDQERTYCSLNVTTANHVCERNAIIDMTSGKAG
jgi:hypothetical protein